MKVLRSFVFAFQGLKYCFKNEMNFKIHCLCSIIAIVMGFVFGISTVEWLVILLCIAFVISLEIINTVIEKLCDLVHPGVHPLIKILKDMSAAAVLVVAIASAVISLIIFLPKIF